jgi:hypothetical protein
MATIIKMTIYSSIPSLLTEKQSYKHYEGLAQPAIFLVYAQFGVMFLLYFYSLFLLLCCHL